MTQAKLTQKVKLITVFATIFLFVLVVFAIVTHIKINSLSSKSAMLDTKIAELSVTQTSLTEGIESRSSDSYVEQQARENLGMIKTDGESVYVIDNNND